MKRNRLLPLLIAALLIAPGCTQIDDAISPSPLTRVYQLRGQYTDAMRVLVKARMLGKINDAEYAALEIQRATAANALDQLEGAAAAGKPIDPSTLADAQVSIANLNAAKSKYEALWKP